jgi:hypothetical protein
MAKRPNQGGGGVSKEGDKNRAKRSPSKTSAANPKAVNKRPVAVKPDRLSKSASKTFATFLGNINTPENALSELALKGAMEVLATRSKEFSRPAICHMCG